MEKQSYSRQLVGYNLAKKLSKQALIIANRVEKSFKIIRRTCFSIRDLRVTKVCHETKIGLKCFRKKLDQNKINWNYSYNQ